jgi:signal transduction histidine kinase
MEHTGAPTTIRGNADAIRDALRNIIENAVAHSLVGGEVTVNVVFPGIIRVVDQGPGIPITLREQVFERLWRRRAELRSGAGLGLAIVRVIMTAHGGIVRIEDNPGGAMLSSTSANKRRPEAMAMNRINDAQMQLSSHSEQPK